MTDKKQSTELVLVENEKEISEESKEYFFQVDFLKAAMIFLVIFDHMVAWGVKSEMGVTLWERISIPVFLVLMGFNMGKSFQKKGDVSLKQLYSWSYFKSKILRYIVPFLVLYGVSTFIGLFMYGFDISAMYNGQYYPQHGIIHLFIGFLPFWGPGNWFLPVIFQSILLMPLLYKAFTKKPVLSLIMCFVVEIAMQLIVFFFIGEITSYEEGHLVTLFMTSVLFYLSGIGLGMWFSFGHNLKSKRNIFMWILFPISLAFCIAYQFFAFRIRIDGVSLLRGDYHFLIFPYSAFLVLLALKFLPQKSEGRISRVISMIGKSTYHILLIQILGYGMITAVWGTHYAIDVGFGPDKILDMIFAWLLFIPFGVLWYKIDKKKNLLKRVLYSINLFIVFVSLLFLTFWGQVFWVPIPLLIILIYAIAALLTNFIIKKPLKTNSLSLWTGFLLMTFIMMVLQMSVLQPNEAWITLIPIGIVLTLAVVGTILDYMNSK
ncbi:MAG: acyltransferase family protein [Candidatus Lokiarchaeota archaeon]|nr:acyltransferase family protein [Candidatus Lokiarchaeota archaeon]